MDSRVPSVPKDGALEAQRQSSLKLVRLALREPGLLKRYFRGKEDVKRKSFSPPLGEMRVW